MNAALAAQPGEVMKSGKCERKLDPFDGDEYVVEHSRKKHPKGLHSAEELLGAGREERENHPHQLGQHVLLLLILPSVSIIRCVPRQHDVPGSRPETQGRCGTADGCHGYWGSGRRPTVGN